MSSVAATRTRYGVPPSIPVEARERSTRHLVGAAWGLLLLNLLTFGGTYPKIPSIVGKGITQGALPLAIFLLLLANRRVILRPNVFLCIVSLLPLEAILTALQPQYLGTIYRTFRLVEFVIALWLLTPWWGRRDLLLVRCHLKAYLVILGSVLLGLVVAPGQAREEGRLAGALWNIAPTQVGHYAAVTTGLVVVLWLCGKLPGRLALGIVVVSVGMLILTHTRTALVGMVAGILIAGLSLVTANARVRKLLATAGIVAGIAILTLSSFITSWLLRGEGTQELTQLTGRTKVWTAILVVPRDKFQEIFGFGLSNSSFNGLSIDSNWLSSYQEQGLFGVTVCAILLIFLIVAASFQPRGVERALALFLVTYCLIASITEDGFTDATPYLLELSLAASLLVASAARRGGRIQRYRLE
jgi:hypothetical protein